MTDTSLCPYWMLNSFHTKWSVIYNISPNLLRSRTCNIAKLAFFVLFLHWNTFTESSLFLSSICVHFSLIEMIWWIMTFRLISCLVDPYLQINLQIGARNTLSKFPNDMNPPKSYRQMEMKGRDELLRLRWHRGDTSLILILIMYHTKSKIFHDTPGLATVRSKFNKT